MKTQQEKDIDEIIRLIEEDVSDWLEINGGMDDFEDTPNDPERPFRFEYQHESISNAKTTRFKKWSGQ